MTLKYFKYSKTVSLITLELWAYLFERALRWAVKMQHREEVWEEFQVSSSLSVQHATLPPNSASAQRDWPRCCAKRPLSPPPTPLSLYRLSGQKRTDQQEIRRCFRLREEEEADRRCWTAAADLKLLHAALLQCVRRSKPTDDPNLCTYPHEWKKSCFRCWKIQINRNRAATQNWCIVI